MESEHFSVDGVWRVIARLCVTELKKLSMFEYRFQYLFSKQKNNLKWTTVRRFVCCPWLLLVEYHMLFLSTVVGIIFVMVCGSGVGSENGAMPDRVDSFHRPNNFGRHPSELMPPLGFKPDFMHHWNLAQAYNPYTMSCSRLPASAQTFERLPIYQEETGGSRDIMSKEESPNSPTDRLVEMATNVLHLGWFSLLRGTAKRALVYRQRINNKWRRLCRL